MQTLPRGRIAAHGAIALVSAAVMLYQIAITRLLSVVLWYHFAFLSISVALLGLGAAGIWFSLRPVKPQTLPRLLLCAALGLPASVTAILQTRSDALSHAYAYGELLWVALVALAMLVPMYALGGVVCLLLVQARGTAVASLYAADLLGATCGAALVIPALAALPTPQLVAALGFLPLLALALTHGFARPGWLVCALLLTAAIAWGEPFEVRYSKLYREQGASAPLHEVWTETARITVLERPIFSPNPDVPWGWGYGAKFVPQPSEERWIDQDGSAGTPVERIRSSPSELAHLGFDVTSAGYQVLSPRRACVIGAGGGRDIATALAFGVERVDAVELNRGIYQLMTGPLALFSGDIYHRPGVHSVVSEGRSFLAQTDQRYDLIQISLVDSWAATAAGAFALSENYLYTVEALELYLSRLTPGGVLSISRWNNSIQPFESARLALLAEEALRRRGVAEPRAHLLMLSGSAIGTLLVGQRPMDGATLARADQVAAERGFVRTWPPEHGERGVSLVSMALTDRGATLAQTGLDLRPPTDDRPFFFQARQLLDLGSEVTQSAPSDVNLQAVGLLRGLVLWLIGLSCVLFFMPFVWLGRPQRDAGFWSGTLYFACIGLGFMLLEGPWLQRCVLLLGHPSTATALVLGSLLAGAGAGSLFAGRFSALVTRRSIWLLPTAALFTTLGLPAMTSAMLDQPLALRCLAAGGMFTATGALLGVALPSGLMRFAPERRAWFWAVNGAASVVASALSIALAMAFGLTITSLVGVAAYVVAARCSRGASGGQEAPATAAAGASGSGTLPS